MGYNIGLRTKSLASKTNIFDSEKVRWVTGGVTLDVSKVNADANGKKSLRSGEFLGKLTTGGKFSPVKRSALGAAAASTDTTITLDANVLGGAAYFQAGDAIDVAGTAATIQSINYTTHVVTLTAAIGVAKNAGDAVKATDGSGVAALMLGEDVDFELDSSGTFGDQVATAFDWARVLNARLPRSADATIKSELAQVTFA